MTENRPVPATYPVVFYDGKHDIDAGDIVIQPFIDIKQLQSVLSSKIGIAPYQANYSIICRKPTKSVRRIPIRDTINFYGILEQEKDCYFLVSLRSSSSRRGGRRSGRSHQQYIQEESDYFTSLQKRFLLHPPQLLLRRDCNAVTPPYYDHPICSSQLQMEKENYLMTMINSYPFSGVDDVCGYGYGGGAGDGDGSDSGCLPLCEVCLKATDEAVPFHWCVYDRTTVGFRSPAGPIQRPSKV